jgi:hypothetical protein
MAKYDPLFEHLCRSGDGALELSFDEIGSLVGGLPQSASRHLAWWQNEAENSRHLHARAWLNAGRTVEHVDMAARRVLFSAARWNRGS